MHNNPMNNEETGFVTAKEFGAYEICLVFPADPNRNNNFSLAGIEVVSTLTEKLGQKHVLMYRSVDRGEIIVLLRANMEVLGQFADKIDFKVSEGSRNCLAVLIVYLPSLAAGFVRRASH
jgi:hypothetical protein